jgi:hypothetical protein
MASREGIHHHLPRVSGSGSSGSGLGSKGIGLIAAIRAVKARLPGEGDVLFADGAPVKIHLVDCWWVVGGVFWGEGWLCCSLIKQTELKK